MFSESPGSGGRQDQSVGPPAPGDTLARPTEVWCARDSHGAKPDGGARARLIFENSTVCHLVDELVCHALIFLVWV